MFRQILLTRPSALQLFSASVLLLLFCSSALLLFGCARPAEVPRQEVPEASNTASAETGVFRIDLTTTHKSFRATEFIPLKLSLYNTGSSDTAVEFPTAQRFDLVAQTEDGKEVWRWSKGRTFAQMVETMDLKAGEGRNFYEKIPVGTLKPGKYRVVGEVMAAEVAKLNVSIQVEVE